MHCKTTIYDKRRKDLLFAQEQIQTKLFAKYKRRIQSVIQSCHLHQLPSAEINAANLALSKTEHFEL
jgi:hypothetical protein